MLLVEIIIIVAVIVMLLAQVEKLRNKRRSTAVPELAGGTAAPANAPHPVSPAATSAPAPLKLSIEGTTQFPLERAAFFGQFGVPVKRICDAGCYAEPGTIDTFPSAVASAIRALYDEGTAVGPEIMRVIYHERALAPDEALYFALTRNGSAERPEYAMYAFLDKVRD
jgi:hypothetical protein